MAIETWQKVFRDGIAPCLSTPALVALRDGLRSDDPKLIQGATTTPPPLMCVLDWPCEAGCPVAFAGWQGDGLRTVGEVEEHFARVCHECGDRMGESAACRWFLNAWDETPRDDMRRELLEEVELALRERGDDPQSVIVRAA